MHAMIASTRPVACCKVTPVMASPKQIAVRTTHAIRVGVDVTAGRVGQRQSGGNMS